MKKIVLFVAILGAFVFNSAMAGAPDTATIRAAIHGGVEWLANHQDTGDGSWGATHNKVGKTAFAVKKLEHHAVDTKYGYGLPSPFDQAYPYRQNVIDGLNYIFDHACIKTIGTQTNGDPDTDNDDVGVYFVSSNCSQTNTRIYETGIALMAIAESTVPDSEINIPGYTNGYGQTFHDLAEDVMNYLAWAQAENYGRGGWGYAECNNGAWAHGSARSDGSNTGYAVLGLQYAQADPPDGFGLPIPDFVKQELDYWLDTIQCNDGGDKDGAGSYASTAPCGGWTNCLETGNILKEMAFCGPNYSPSSGNGEDTAICYLVRHWYLQEDGYPSTEQGWRGGDCSQSYNCPSFPSYMAMYTMTKGLVATGHINPAEITCGDTIIHWQDDFDSVIVATQNSDSSWGPDCWDIYANGGPSSQYGDTVLSTVWALLVLEKAVPPPPPELGKVIIPNTVYERFGYGHWDPPDTVFQDDACPPYGGVNPGDFFEIPILLEDFSGTPAVSIGSFYFEVEFDYIDLTFYGAERGDLLLARWNEPEGTPFDTTFSWEYFSYRLCPCAYPGCLKYKIVIFGQAEMPDGLFRQGYCINPADLHPEIEAMDHFDPTMDLVWLRFQVANNELLRDLKLPIEFEWEHTLGGEFGHYYITQDWDCAENTMGSCDGADLYVSANDTLQYNPDVCGLSQPGGGDIFQILNFIDGGVHVCSPCTAFKCVRGDINMNHIAYDPADPVLLARAIVFGVLATFWDIDNQKCASDVNADGRPVMLADLIYLIRVIQKDALPYPKLGPSSDVANLIVSADRITVECASPIGGLLFEFDNAVTPTLLNTDMEILANKGRVLVWSRDGNSLSAGTSEILSFAGAELVSVAAVDREGRDLATTITNKVAPSSFALYPAYPNPFNPYINLSFSLPNAAAYSMKIYNVAGQLVRNYEGMGVAGVNVITWDGKDNAGSDVSSGVYFFKLFAGIYNATSKMVLMK